MHKIVQEGLLLEYLFELYPQKKKKEIKNLLTHKCVLVNHQVVTQYNYILKSGDVIEILKTSKNTTSLDILYEDQELIVINKPAGLLTIATQTEKNKTAYHQVSDYLKESNHKAKVFIVHRLDQETSGVLIFAKNEKIKQLLQNSWNELVLTREYLAIVEGKVTVLNKTVKSYLKESKTQMVYSTNDKQNGKLAITHYRQLKSIKGYTLLEVRLDTGRKNQIRVHMQDCHHSIIGDKKYGAKTNPIKRLGLHCHVVEVVHPINHRKMVFKANIPQPFIQLMKL